MGDVTNIGWCDHSFNPWWGCSRVSRACKECYAAAWARRWGHDVFHRDGERRILSDRAWANPRKWAKAAEAAGVPERTFSLSMGDVFERHPALDAPRQRLWDLIGETWWLDWLLLTKRPENILDMAPWADEWPGNVWAGTSTEDQRNADIRIPELARVRAWVRFLSVEPLVGRVDLTPWLDAGVIDWVIVGGETGPGRDDMNLVFLEDVVDQAVSRGVPVFVKQDSGPVPGKQGRITDEIWGLKQFPETVARAA